MAAYFRSISSTHLQNLYSVEVEVGKLFPHPRQIFLLNQNRIKCIFLGNKLPPRTDKMNPRVGVGVKRIEMYKNLT